MLNHFHTFRPRLFLLVVLVLAGIPSLGGYAAGEAACRRVPVAPDTLDWVSSVAYSEEENALLVVDPRQGKVQMFDASGKYLQAMEAPLVKPGERIRPTSVYAGAGGILLKLAQPEAILLQGSGLTARRIALGLDGDGKGAAVGSIYGATLFDGWMVGYGSVRLGPTDLADPQAFVLGFFRAPLRSMPFGAQPVLLLDENKYYLSGYQYVTSNDDAVFFVKMAAPAEVYRVDRNGKTELLPAAVPEGFRDIGRLEVPTSGPETAELFYEKLASRAIPAGLYGQGDQLFLLTREPVGDRTEWSLHEIDPDLGGLVGEPLVLPTQAEHLAVATSQERWYFVEKGAVRSPATQEIASILVIDADVIAEASARKRLATCR